MFARLIDGDYIEDAYDGALSMIIGNKLAQTLTGANHSVQHLLNADENEAAECIQGSPKDLLDMLAAAKRHGKKHAMMQFIVAPYLELTRDQFFQCVLPLLAAVFGFQAFQAVVFEHIKPRQNGNASKRHWHVCVSYTDPITNRVNPGWKWSHAKCERIGRELEARFEPDNILLGRHQAAVIRQLRTEGLDAVADKIERAHPAGTAPEHRTPALAIEQAAKIAGIELRDAMAAVRGCWHRSTNRTEFIDELEDNFLKLAISNREKPAWVITDPDGVFINLLSKCLPGVTRVNIHTKIGEPNHDGRGEGHGQRAEVARNAARDPGEPDVHAQHDGDDDRASDLPVGDHDRRAAQVFVAALNDAEPDALDDLLSRASALAQSAMARVLEYCRGLEYRARCWLEKRQTSHKPPEPDVTLASLQERGAEIEARLGVARVAILESGSLISRLMRAPRSSKPGERSRQSELNEATKKYENLTAEIKRIERELQDHCAAATPFEKAFDDRMRTWESRHDFLARTWLSIAERIRRFMVSDPAAARFGPRALYALGLPREPAGSNDPPTDPGDIFRPQGPK
ncbi:hypothetical protein WN73_38545 [Bradyrhizobium sp. CCBAU 45394]|uniref:hypothetical protein n=1 Tax=Bradyrhizobium sp. CCBAU 45394 TaxID=1325087 RepID=UPI00230488E9|nr:hypothetical protein [Bradyrhizobium sp. CCBAU 45394]MDA9396414.1 hypothetical protein [Bradyrhizobium sp. CCBAU 45394]